MSVIQTELKAGGWKSQGHTLWAHPDVDDSRVLPENLAYYILCRQREIKGLKGTIEAFQAQPMEIWSLQGRYAARYAIPPEKCIKPIPADVQAFEWLTVEFVGQIKGEWVAMVLGDEGKLVVATEREGFVELMSTALQTIKRDIEMGKIDA